MEDEVIYLLSFDLPSEHIKGLSDRDSQFLVSMRSKIWYNLRYVYGCKQLQKSLWKVPKESLEKVQEAVEKWESEYKGHGYPAKLWIFPISTTEEGMEAFDMMEVNFLMYWLEKDMKYLNTAQVKKTAFNRISRKIELIRNIVEEDFSGNVRDAVKDRVKQLRELLDAFDKWLFEVEVVPAKRSS